MNQKSLDERLGGYEGISAIVEEFMSRLKGDSQLERFWQNRGDMKTAHKGMKISRSDWSILIGHCAATMEAVQASQKECDKVVSFLSSFKNEIVKV